MHNLLYGIRYVCALSRRNVRYDQIGVPAVRSGTSAKGVDVMLPRIVSDSGQARVKRRLAAILTTDVACYNHFIGNNAEGTVAWSTARPAGQPRW